MSKPALFEITVNDIGEYIRHQSCDRRFFLRVHYDREVRPLPFFDRLLNTLEPVLSQVGKDREDQWEKELTDNGFRDLAAGLPKGKHDDVAWSDFAEELARLSPSIPAYARQVRVQANLGAFGVSGLIDFVLVKWNAGRPRLWLVECKASRRDRTYHRIQVALYRILLQRMLSGRGVLVGGLIVPADSVECMIARIDEDRNTNQSILTLPPLDLTSEEADIELLLGVGGRLDLVVARPLADIGYRLDTKCDGCVYNVHCLTESARLRRPELLGIDPVSSRLLHAAGIKTLDDLARPPVFQPPSIEALLRNPGFDENLKLLEIRAKARRHTLPVLGATAPAEEYDVASIPNTGVGHLPAHEGERGRLLRVYLAVDYDYSENRIGALSAHATRSDGRLHTRFVETAGRWEPDSELYEQVADKTDEKGRPRFSKEAPLRSVRGRDLVEFKTAPWKGNNYEDDTAAERELIQRFFYNLVNLIAEEAGQDAVPIHFYVWSQGEIRQLIEGCCRAGSNLLGHLQQLLGCREGLEQLIYSCVRDEIDRRFALGWTGRGLGVVASLQWFGRRYHWRRKVNGVPCNLDHEFTQNVFDFKTQLDLDATGNWAESGAGTKHTFEIRSRFSDSLPAAYWHAVWRTLPDPTTVKDQRLKNSIERYNRARVPNMLKTYLNARCHALRWLEENVGPKNPEITKPAVTIADLPDFHLDRDDVAKAALDFLRLDQHVKKSNWIAEHLLPPLVRVPLGRTLPLRGMNVSDDKKTITGRIELSGFNGLMLADLETRCSFAPGSFVRLSPWNGDPQRGQTVPQLTSAIGRTCVVQSIDWGTGAVTLESMYAEADGYTTASGASRQAEPLFTDGYGTLDESVTDFVARRVDDRLQGVYPVYGWFDPITPAPPPVLPPPTGEINRIRRTLESFRLPPADQLPQRDQVQAVIDGLSTRVQLLQGPPGTGKTTTTALSVLLRIVCSTRPGDTVLLSAHTHRALDELLARIDRYAAAFARHAVGCGFTMPTIRLVKAHSGDPTMNCVGGSVENLPVSALKTKKKLIELTGGGVLVLGGTTAGLLKLAAEVDKLKTYNNGNGMKGSVLVVDEASMMVFPHFLALATLVAEDGRIMLTGDHRQLAPITAHDWDNEDRPPTVLYQPFASAYDAVRRIVDTRTNAGSPLVPSEAASRSALRQTFRLPPVVRELIARIYRQDQIELTGPDREAVAGAAGGTSLWHSIWRWNIGVFLVVHSEDGSKRSNETELEIVNQILQAAPPLPPRSVAVITPHRAQRSLFTSRLTVSHGDDQAVDTIDTVERLQGGERPTVIVSATVSDPTAIESNVEFILDLNRANVAFSRVQQRLIVVCSQTLLNHIPAEVEHYQAAILWKALRELCTVEIGRVNVGRHIARLLMPPPQKMNRVPADT
jgi:hypothetical protein